MVNDWGTAGAGTGCWKTNIENYHNFYVFSVQNKDFFTTETLKLGISRNVLLYLCQIGERPDILIVAENYVCFHSMQKWIMHCLFQISLLSPLLCVSLSLYIWLSVCLSVAFAELTITEEDNMSVFVEMQLSATFQKLKCAEWQAHSIDNSFTFSAESVVFQS